MMKKMDVTFGEIELLPLETIGDHLIKYQRKKCFNKKHSPSILYFSLLNNKDNKLMNSV